MEALDLRKEFKTEQSTFIFILLSIVTYGAYSFYWVLRSLEIFQKNYEINQAIIKNLVILEIIIIALIGISPFTLGLTLFIAIGIAIFMAFKYRDILNTLFKQKQINITPNIAWLILFGEFYMYYCLRNAEMSSSIETPKKGLSVAEQLEKLKNLKESGVLSDEEFNTEKHKLLS